MTFSDKPLRQMELNPNAAANPLSESLQIEDTKRRLERLELESRDLAARKQALEEANRKKEHFSLELNELGNKIYSRVKELDAEIEAMATECDQLKQMQDSFQNHLKLLTKLQPDAWTKDDFFQRYESAIPYIEKAEMDYEDATIHGGRLRYSKIFSKTKNVAPRIAGNTRSYGEQMMNGFIFHLPLAIMFLIVWLIYHFS